MISTHKNEYHLITCLNLFSNFSQKYTIFIFLFHVAIKHTLCCLLQMIHGHPLNFSFYLLVPTSFCLVKIKKMYFYVCIYSQGIQAMDRHRVCAEYWESRPLMQIPQHSQSQDNSSGKDETSYGQNGSKMNQQPAGVVDTILGGLFKKANPEELYTLYNVLSNNNSSTTDHVLVNRLLCEEIHNRPR